MPLKGGGAKKVARIVNARDARFGLLHVPKSSQPLNTIER
jgi:hypothetical protein